MGGLLLCAFADFALVEIGFTGKEQELSSGNSWAVQCEEQEVGDKMIVDVDITKYRVQPFKSYKVCISWRTPPQGRSSAECAHIRSPSNGLCPMCPPLEKSLRLSVPSSPLRGRAK